LSPEEQRLLSTDPEKKKESVDKFKAFCQEHLRPIYQKVFDRHDTDKSGKINKEQSVAFFKNLKAEYKSVFVWRVEEYALAIAVGILEHIPGEHSDDDKKAWVDKVKANGGAAIDAVIAQFAKEDDLFALCDGGDGGIPFDNFYELFVVGTERQVKVADAFGMGEEHWKAVCVKIAELSA